MPSIDASDRTLVVSWKEAAERKDSVAGDALVIRVDRARAGIEGMDPDAVTQSER